MAALLAAAALALTACAGSDDKGEPDDGGDRGASLATTSDADWKPVADILGRTGKLNDGSVYKIGFARSDLSVQTKGVTVAPALSLGSWVAFARTPDGQTMLMGDLVVTEDELASVTDAVQAGGLQQTALHKHLLEQSPPIWWTHIAGHGDAADLARAVRSRWMPPTHHRPPRQLPARPAWTWTPRPSMRRWAAPAPSRAGCTNSSSPAAIRSPCPACSSPRPWVWLPPSTSSPPATAARRSTAISS